MDLLVLQSFVKAAAISADDIKKGLAEAIAAGEKIPINQAPAPRSFLRRAAPAAAVAGVVGLGAYALGRHHGRQDQYPTDYHATKEAAMRKLAWSWEGFKEGIRDEGIPLGGAALGAAVGGRWNKGLTGAALGYAAGGGASLLRSKLKGEKPSEAQKVLAMSALGYGLGGLGHAALSRRFVGRPGTVPSLFHEHIPGQGMMNMARSGIEEALPAAGAVLGTGYAMGSMNRPERPKQLSPVAQVVLPHLRTPSAPQPVVPPSVA